MNTGEMPTVSSNLNVGSENKKSVLVDGAELMTQSHSRSRGGRMDLRGGNALPQDQSC